MWIASTAGFFSIVKHNQQADTFMVRARVKGDLENLRKLCSLPQAVVATATADYPFRLIVSREQKDLIVRALGDGIDYPNFKSEVAKTQGQTAKLNAYHSVWATMNGVEEKDARK